MLMHIRGACVSMFLVCDKNGSLGPNKSSRTATHNNLFHSIKINKHFFLLKHHCYVRLECVYPGMYVVAVK